MKRFKGPSSHFPIGPSRPITSTPDLPVNLFTKLKKCLPLVPCFFAALISSCDRSNMVIVDAGSGTWEVVREPQDATYFYDIYFADRLRGWVVGDSGKILHTDDAGTSWQPQTSGTRYALRCVVFPDEHTGWVAGSHASVLHTDNGGISWTPQAVAIDSSRTFLSICFVDAMTGWAVTNYGEIIHTANGGVTWVPQTSGTHWAITSICFLDRLNGWAVATNRIVLRTIDGGARWNTQEIPIRSPTIFTDIYFSDSYTGWISTTMAASSSLEDGSPVLRTTDSGVTWVTVAEVPLIDITSIRFINNTMGWAVGMNGIYYTNAGGSNWVCQYEGLSDVLVGLSFVEGTDGWALGFTGTILRYTIR